MAQSAQPVATLLPKPRGDHRVLTFNPTGSYDKVPADLLKDEELPDVPIVACSSCGRKFREDRLEKHQNACAKLLDGSTRRGAFNSSLKR